jgi:hypothetical protein
MDVINGKPLLMTNFVKSCFLFREQKMRRVWEQRMRRVWEQRMRRVAPLMCKHQNS